MRWPLLPLAAVIALGLGLGLIAWAALASIAQADHTPPFPGVPVVTPSLTGADITWAAPASGDVTTYQYAHKLNDGTQFSSTDDSLWTDEASTSVSLSGLTSATRYKFAVRACHVGTCGPQSSIDYVTLVAAPQDLVVRRVANDPTAVELGWTALSGDGIVGFEIQWSEDNMFAAIAEDMMTTTTGNSSQVILRREQFAVTDYHFRVAAQTAQSDLHIGQSGPYSSAVLVDAAGRRSPDRPTGLSATRNGNDVVISWTAPSALGTYMRRESGNLVTRDNVISDYEFQLKRNGGSFGGAQPLGEVATQVALPADYEGSTIRVRARADRPRISTVIGPWSAEYTIPSETATVSTLSFTEVTLTEGESRSLVAELDHLVAGPATVISFSADQSGQVKLDPEVLTISQGNWVSDVVRVTAVDDDAVEDATTVTLTVAVGGNDLVSLADGLETVTVTIVDNDFVDNASGTPTISGTAHPARELTAGVGDITDPNGVPPAAQIAWQWVLVDGENETLIDGATGATYTVRPADEGKSLRVRATFNDLGENQNGRNTESLVSSPVLVTNAPTLTLTLSETTIDENPPGRATLTANLDRALSETTTITVSATVSDEPSGAVRLSPRTLTIPSGETASSNSITVTAVNNTLGGDATVRLSGAVQSGSTVNDQAAVTLTITDDDATADMPTTVTLSLSETAIDEVGGGDRIAETVLTATLSRGQSTETTLTVAADPSDAVELNGGMITIPAGETTGTLSLTAENDTSSSDDRLVRLSATVSDDSIDAPAVVELTVRDVAVDYDLDDDGLIEISNLAQLNAVRWDLDGDSAVVTLDIPKYTAAFPNAVPQMGCPSTCTGYELTADLDFDTNGNGMADADDAYWNGGEGWEPIGPPAGTINNATLAFHADFVGNGHAIKNLFIDRNRLDVGLFGQAATSEAQISHLRLENVNVKGRDRVGALIGIHGFHNQDPRVSHVIVTGTVRATGDEAGGLIGNGDGIVSHSAFHGSVSGRQRVGGLVGHLIRGGKIEASYAAAQVSGQNIVGGLVGRWAAEGQQLLASYAIGSVQSTGSGAANAGGLVGIDTTASGNTSTIDGSYASVRVTSSSATNVGGLIGAVSGRMTITNSYYDTSVTSQSAPYTGTPAPATDVRGYRGSELSQPTGYETLYDAWNLDLDGDTATDDDPWDFGTDQQYPALKADLDNDGTASAAEFGYQVRTAPDLTATVAANRRSVRLTWIGVSQEWGDQPAPAISYAVHRAGAVIAPDLTATSYTDTSLEENTVYDYQVAVLLDGVEARRGARAVLGGDGDGDGLIEITNRTQLNAVRWDLDGNGMVDDAANAARYASAFVIPQGGSLCHPGPCTGYELSNDITLSGSWTPIGGNVPGNSESPYSPGGNLYTASFEGNDKTISGLRVSRGSSNLVGLFGATGSGATIRNVCLSNVNVRGREAVGALVGYNQGTVSDSCSTGQVTGNALAGGLVGWNRGTVDTSYSQANVTGFNTSGPGWSTQLGGLVGANYGTVQDTYATGRVRGATHVAGLAGAVWNTGVVRNSYSIGAVSSDRGSTFVGGLAGWVNGGTVENSYWNVETSGQGQGFSQVSAGGRINDNAGQTTDALRNPTSNSGIYAGWDPDTWSFCTDSEYPRLDGVSSCPAATARMQAVPSMEPQTAQQQAQTAQQQQQSEPQTSQQQHETQEEEESEPAQQQGQEQEQQQTQPAQQEVPEQGQPAPAQQQQTQPVQQEVPEQGQPAPAQQQQQPAPTPVPAQAQQQQPAPTPVPALAQQQQPAATPVPAPVQQQQLAPTPVPAPAQQQQLVATQVPALAQQQQQLAPTPVPAPVQEGQRQPVEGPTPAARPRVIGGSVPQPPLVILPQDRQPAAVEPAPESESASETSPPSGPANGPALVVRPDRPAAQETSPAVQSDQGWATDMWVAGGLSALALALLVAALALYLSRRRRHYRYR